MPSKTGKAPASYYKSDVSVDQSTNVGFDTTVRSIISGDGASSCLGLGTRSATITPAADSTAALDVENAVGNSVLAVDTTNSKVLIGASQVAANTQYAHFGIDFGSSSSYSADTHYAIPFVQGNSASSLAAMGSSTSSSFNDTNPANLTLTTGTNYYVNTYWLVMDIITIDAVIWFSASDTATGDDTATHLMSYVVDTANGSTGGNLSSGVVVADGATITNAGYEQIYYQSMTIQSADVDAGRVILFTFASDTVNSDYSINATVKYHIR